jgi:hypothetical protein
MQQALLLVPTSALLLVLRSALQQQQGKPDLLLRTKAQLLLQWRALPSTAA